MWEHKISKQFHHKFYIVYHIKWDPITKYIKMRDRSKVLAWPWSVSIKNQLKMTHLWLEPPNLLKAGWLLVSWQFGW